MKLLLAALLAFCAIPARAGGAGGLFNGGGPNTPPAADSVSTITTNTIYFGAPPTVSSGGATGALTLASGAALTTSGSGGNIVGASSITTTGGLFGGTLITTGKVGIRTSVVASSATLEVAGTIIQRGITDGLDASSGTVGEYISTSPISDLNLGSIATGTLVTIATTTVSAGDWEVGGQAILGLSGATATGSFACISLTPAACSSSFSTAAGTIVGTSENSARSINPMRLNVTVPTAVYLTVRGDYTVAGSAKWSATSNQIWARRMR